MLRRELHDLICILKGHAGRDARVEKDEILRRLQADPRGLEQR